MTRRRAATLGNAQESANRTTRWPARVGHRWLHGLAPGCSFPKDRSAFGVCDLAGNLSEWVALPNDRSGLAAEPILMGGNWLYADPAALRLSARARVPAAIGGFYLSGFRCARSAGR